VAVGTTGTLLAGRYRIKRALGRGGMATVYLADDERLGREVAVKRLHAGSAEDMELRFVREAKLGASLNHPNLVWVFDTVTDEEGLLIIMEYVDGPTLARELSDGPLRPRRAVEVIAATASALEHAHEQGVVHRDVKPANVLLGRGGVIKLADLGIATAADHTRITRSGVALGTASYMAPEQIEGERVTPATDVYALATVAFELLAGRKARSGRTPMEVAHAITAKPPPDLREAWQQAPAEAAEVVITAMARDPADRPDSVCEFASELARALGEETTARVRLDAARAATGGAAAAGAAAGAAAAPDTAEASPTDEPTVTHAPEPSRPPNRPSAPAPSPPNRPRAPSPPRRGQYAAPRRSFSAGLVAAGAALTAVVVVVVLAAGGGGEPERPRDGSAEPTPPDTAAPQAGRGGSAGGQGSGAGGQGGSAAASVPQPANEGGASEGARLNRQGFGLLNRGQYAQAVPVLERSVEAFPPGTTDVKYGFALYNLGRALRLSGRAGAAVPVLERRLQIPNQRETVQKELDAARRAAG